MLTPRLDVTAARLLVKGMKTEAGGSRGRTERRHGASAKSCTFNLRESCGKPLVPCFCKTFPMLLPADATTVKATASHIFYAVSPPASLCGSNGSSLFLLPHRHSLERSHDGNIPLHVTFQTEMIRFTGPRFGWNRGSSVKNMVSHGTISHRREWRPPPDDENSAIQSVHHIQKKMLALQFREF